ncbi:hypothetical protein [Nocardia sp. IFM 10818]
MTAPNGATPDGAYVIGSDFGSKTNKDQVKPMIEGSARKNLTDAFSLVGGLFQKIGATRADHFDGQNQLKDRTDLIRDASGYGSAFMGYNWDVPPSKWVVVPFDTQLGPVKGLTVGNHGLVLKKGGLWRVDAHATVSGYTLNQTIMPLSFPPYFTVITTYNPILPNYLIEVINADGTLYTSRMFHAVANMSFESQGLFGVNFPQSSAFSHTFVLDHMPPESSPGADTHWKTVRLSMGYNPVNAGTFNTAYCTIKGGTKKSALIASRWSRDVSNINYQHEVPNGGRRE